MQTSLAFELKQSFRLSLLSARTADRNLPHLAGLSEKSHCSLAFVHMLSVEDTRSRSPSKDCLLAGEPWLHCSAKSFSSSEAVSIKNEMYSTGPVKARRDFYKRDFT